MQAEQTALPFLQMAGVASALVVLVTILKLGPLFQELPKVSVALLFVCTVKIFEVNICGA